MLNTLIVPGVGGSESAHWQSWLHRQLPRSTRIEQHNWNLPILSEWIKPVVAYLAAQKQPVEVVAHSFGCLTILAALSEHPELQSRIHRIVLVAPANPNRFNATGFARDDLEQPNLSAYFANLRLRVPALLLVSENDPWLSQQDALFWARRWDIQAINLGAVGHVNVASGFGAWPQIYHYLDSQPELVNLSTTKKINPLFQLAI